MEKLVVRHCRKQFGLTLIEVLIALSIISIALTAIIKATSQNIRTTGYLQTKTIAMWVGQQVLNEARVNLLRLPNSPDTLKQSTTMLGHDWFWEADQQDTPNKRIKKIEVKVFAKEPEDDAAPALITLESYVYHEDEQ